MSPTILTIGFSCLSGFVAVCLLTLMIAGGANSSPEFAATLKWMMWAVLISTSVCIVAAVGLLMARQPAAAMLASVLPMQICIILFVVLWDIGKVQGGDPAPSTAKIVVRALVLLIFGGGGLVMFYVGAREHHLQRLLLNFSQPVMAEILESKVFTSETSVNRQPGEVKLVDSTQTHRPDVRFRYVVDGKEYESDLLYPAAIVRTYASESSAAEELKPFPPGAKVTAYVNAELPGKAYLVPEKSAGPVVFLILGFCLPTVAVLAGKLV